MEIIKSNLIGFCNGVNHTIEEANKYLETNNELYCLGEIVHNGIVIKELEDKGMKTINDLNEVPNNKTVIFRAHGEPKESYQLAEQKQLKVIDLTCGKVKVIHQKILKNNDKYIIIIGKSNHPEVIAHYSYVKEGKIVENIEDIPNLEDKNDIYIVVQTTFNEEKFNTIINEIKKLYPSKNIIIDNTICHATHNRQIEIEELSKRVTKMLVIGSNNSSNTKELYNIAKQNCNDTYLINDDKDLTNILFKINDIIGVTSGASTSNKTIDNIINSIKNIDD